MTERLNFKGRVLNLVGDAMPIPEQRRLVPRAYREARYVEFNSATLGHVIAFEDNKAWTRHQDLQTHDIPVMSLAYYRDQINLLMVPPSSESLRSFMQRNAEQPEVSASVLRQCGAILAKTADIQIMPTELRPPSFKDQGLLPHALTGQFAVTHRAGQEPHVTASLPYVFPDRSSVDIVRRVTEEMSVSGFFLPPVERSAGGLAVGSDLQDAVASFREGFYRSQG